MGLVDCIVIALLVLAVLASIIAIVRGKKQGGCGGYECRGNCAGCRKKER